MSLFVVEHTHPGEVCPAGHPEMGPMLVKHVMPSNALTYGVTIRADAVVNGGHTYVVIAEADDADKVKNFMAPFFQMGEVKISPSSTCEAVVARKKC